MEPHAPVLTEEALDGRLVGRLVVTGEGHDDLAVPCVPRPLHDHEVAVEDARVDHRVALDPQDEVTAQRLGHGHVVLDILRRVGWRRRPILSAGSGGA